MRTKAVTAKQPISITGVTRLRAAMKPDTSLKRVARYNRILLRLLPVMVLPFAGAVLLAMHPPRVPEPGAQAVKWLDVFFFGVAGVTIVAAFIYATWRVMKAWEDSAPESPGRAIKEFYREAAGGRPSARRLGALLATFEVPGPRVQPVFHWMTAAAFPALDSPKTVAKYWRALIRGNREVTRQLKITGIEIEQPIADVAIATVHMQATVTRRVQAMIAALVGCLIAIAPFFLGAERVEQFGISFWTAVAAASALGIAVGWLLRKILRAVAERREVAVRKFLVRSGYNWRLVSGEWETQDEADISWLDPRELKV
ncbi:MAG: hypothetical protein H6839_10440 [Planctomycetes bacterium]|nr:hypothetical protein [Planctomycetota bacterium]